MRRGGGPATTVSRALVAYAGTVVAAGAGVVGAVVAIGLAQPPASSVDRGTGALLAVGLLVGELLRVRVARRSRDGSVDRLTASSTFAVALVLTGQLLAAVLVQVTASVLDDVRGHRRPLVLAFNAAQLALALATVHCVHALASGVRPLSAAEAPAVAAGPAVAAACAYFAANNALVGVVLSLDSGRPLTEVVGENLRSQGLNSAILLGMAPVAALVATTEPALLPLVALPLLGVLCKARLAARSEHASLHDELTGLPNRALFRARAQEAVSRRSPGRTAAMLVDLDHFKDVNDSLGHHAGDGVLREAADRMRAALPDDVTVARFGGDEFAILVPDVSTEDEATALADALMTRLGEPVAVDGVLFGVRASVGVAVSPRGRGDGQADVDTLLRHADVALYRAKARRGEVQCYRPRSGDVPVGVLSVRPRPGGGS